MPIALLPDRAVVTVTGTDATGLLQGVVTCNVETLEPGEARLGALLTPQGKVLFDFLISRIEGGYRLDTDAARAPDLVKRLTLYRLRAKVALALDPTITVAAAWDGAGTAMDTDTVSDGRLAALGTRLYAAEGAFSADATEADYHAHRIALGIPEGGRDFAFSDAFPHEALMDQLGGVDFRKGCYVGQEVVSRMQHRGTARRRLVLIEAEGHLTPGSDILAGDRSIGTVLSATGRAGMALVRIDRLAAALADGSVLSADGVPVEAGIPPWAGYALPEPGVSGAADTAS